MSTRIDELEPVGSRLREWRRRRQRSQMDLALGAGVSARHLSWVETGRSQPGPAVIQAIADELELPLRERNELLLAAGHAPAFPRHAYDAPDLEPVRETIDLLLAAHDPFPAAVVDRHWNLVAANHAMAGLARLVDPALLDGPLNVMRLGLHPDGLARHITNLDQVYAHFVGRLERQVAATADPVLTALLDDVRGYRDLPPAPDPVALARAGQIASPTMELALPDGRMLALFATVATFGTATEVTTSELSIELAFPADAATAALLRREELSQQVNATRRGVMWATPSS